MNLHIRQALAAQPSATWEVVDQIYATAVEPERWPQLLESMCGAMAWGLAEREDDLVMHLLNAVQVNSRLGARFDVERCIEPALASFRFPFLVIDRSLDVRYAGALFSAARHRAPGFAVFDHGLGLSPEIARDIAQVFEGERQSCALPTLCTDDEALDVIAFMISEGLMMIALLDATRFRKTSVSMFADSYGLTESESSLVADLMEGDAYAQIALRRGVTESTVRTQVKNIYAKTHCHHRADLINRVACGPSLLQSLTEHETGSYIDQPLSSPRLHQRLDCGGGLQLGFAEFGPEDGRPLVFLHNVSGSRLQLPVPEGQLKAQNVRLIVPDRPGVGLSSWPRALDMSEWAAAFALLLDQLGLDRCVLLGNSMGGVYAMACAYHLPERVSRLVLVSTMGQMTEEGDLAYVEEDMRKIITLGRRYPRLASAMLKLLIRDVPTRYIDRRIGKLPNADRALYRNTDFYNMAVDALMENFRNGLAPMVRDYVSLSQPWQFDPAAIRTSVDLWHGECDITSPLVAVERLAACFPSVRCQFIEGETHMLLYRHWHTIVAQSLTD